MPTTVTVDVSSSSWLDTGVDIPNGASLQVTVSSNSVIFGGTSYSFPEGGYPPSYPSIHAYDPSSVSTTYNSEGTFGNFISHDVPPYALTLKVASAQPTGTLVPGCLRPNQSALFTPAQLGTGRVWLIFNDNFYGDNSGTWTVTLTVIPATSPIPTPSGPGGGVTGFKYVWRKRLARPTPHCIGALVGKNTQIYLGNPLVLTVNPIYTGTGNTQYPVVRPLQASDTISTQNGILGVALMDLVTDANGRPIRNNGPLVVDDRGRGTFGPHSLNDLPTDPVTGYLRIPIASFDDDNVFAGWTNANQIANFYDVGRPVGIVPSSTSINGVPSAYQVNLQAAAGASCLMVESVETEDSRFNDPTGGGIVYVRCLPSFYARNIANGFFNT